MIIAKTTWIVVIETAQKVLKIVRDALRKKGG